MGIGYYICVPFAWLLKVLYDFTASYGVALILFTLVIKLIMLPFQMKSKKSMVRMQRLQPKVKEIEAKYANNKQKASEEVQMLYVKEGINPMSGCLWTLLPFPLLIALYSIIRQPLTRFMMLTSEAVTKLREFAATLGYGAAAAAGGTEELPLANFISAHFNEFTAKFPDIPLININYNFLGLDLSQVPQNRFGELSTGGWAVIGLLLIPVISAALSFLQSKIASAGTDSASQGSNVMMKLLMPLLSLWIAYTLPAALGIYWIASSVFMIIQDVLLNKYYNNRAEQELTEREKKKRDERLARMEAARQQQREYRQQEERPKKQPEKKPVSTNENGRLGDRPYARGRSFDPNHYGE